MQRQRLQTRPKWQRILLGGVRILGWPALHGNCLALYTHEGALCDIKGCFQVLHEQFLLLGKSPDLIGFGNSEHMISYEKGLRKINKEGWDGIRSLDIKSSWSAGGFISGWTISISIAPELGCLFLCVASDFAKVDDGYLASVAERLWKYFEFDYGFVYRHRLDRGPDFYAVGIIVGLNRAKASGAERSHIAKWFNANSYFREHGDWRSYHMRDVYEVNFLAPIHLEQMVDGIRLEDWISKSSSRGVIEPFAPGRAVWRIQKTDIQAVRDALIKNSLLVAYRSDIPPIGKAAREPA